MCHSVVGVIMASTFAVPNDVAQAALQHLILSVSSAYPPVMHHHNRHLTDLWQHDQSTFIFRLLFWPALVNIVGVYYGSLACSMRAYHEWSRVWKMPSPFFKMPMSVIINVFCKSSACWVTNQ